jgi:hypothetical protein
MICALRRERLLDREDGTLVTWLLASLVMMRYASSRY